MWKVRSRTRLAAAVIGSAAALIPLTAGSGEAQATNGCAGPGACAYNQNWYRIGDPDDTISCDHPEPTNHVGHLELYGSMIDVDGIRISSGWQLHRMATPHC